MRNEKSSDRRQVYWLFSDWFLKDELRIFSFSEKKKKKEKPHQER